MVDAPVVLAALHQEANIAAEEIRIEASLPIAPLREHATIATVNVVRDADGLVRSFLYGQMLGTEEVLSMPAEMASVWGPVGSLFMIDFSIRPETCPQFRSRMC